MGDESGLIAALLFAAAVSLPQCDTTLTPPDGWVAVRVTPQRTDAALRCEIGVEPRHWSAMRERSPWSIDEAAPIEIYVFPPETSFDAAVVWMGFVRGSHGFGVETATSFGRAEAVTLGDFTGYRADTLYRGSAKDGTRDFSGTRRALVLRRGARVIGVTITSAPDLGILPQSITEAVIRSIR